MRFTKAALTALMLAVTAGSAQAAAVPDLNVSTIVTIEATFARPSCDITVPPAYNLGTLTPGPKTHASLDITWTCADGGTPVKTALTAAIAKGRASGDDKVILKTDSGTDTGATLSLKETTSGALISLTGGNYFCSDASAVAGVTRRTCSLTPETNVSQSGPFGLASATLRFEVGYP